MTGALAWLERWSGWGLGRGQGGTWRGDGCRQVSLCIKVYTFLLQIAALIDWRFDLNMEDEGALVEVDQLNHVTWFDDISSSGRDGRTPRNGSKVRVGGIRGSPHLLTFLHIWTVVTSEPFVQNFVMRSWMMNPIISWLNEWPVHPNNARRKAEGWWASQ